ncbi:TRAP transporter small permease [Marinomonas agarivorans]|nr:TRAP transporter small permease [Marinomonas agarivorans]
MSLLIKITRVLSAINNVILFVFKYLALSAVAAMTVIIIVQVCFRYVLNNSLPWSEELARYLMVWMTFLALPVVSRLQQHAALEIILGNISAYACGLIKLFLYLIIGIVIYYAFDRSYDFAAKGTRSLAAALPITKAWSYTAMPVGFFAMGLVYIELFLQQVIDLISMKNNTNQSTPTTDEA